MRRLVGRTFSLSSSSAETVNDTPVERVFALPVTFAFGISTGCDCECDCTWVLNPDLAEIFFGLPKTSSTSSTSTRNSAKLDLLKLSLMLTGARAGFIGLWFWVLVVSLKRLPFPGVGGNPVIGGAVKALVAPTPDLVLLVGDACDGEMALRLLVGETGVGGAKGWV
jgi:hypothetical protein